MLSSPRIVRNFSRCTPLTSTRHVAFYSPAERNHEIVTPQQIEGIAKKNEFVKKFDADTDHAFTAILRKKLDMLWTYNSLAIEGNRLSLGDTIFYLENGLSVAGKPIRDFLEATGHAEAIVLLQDFACGSRDLSRYFLCEINQLLTGHVKEIDAITSAGNRVKVPFTAGRYRNNPTHVLTKDGSIHRYVEAYLIDGEMQALIDYVNRSPDHPIVKAAVAHYNFVRIHPFQDGNGRGARILMNLVLIKGGLPPTVVQVHDREKYLGALRAADNGDITPFAQFIVSSIDKTLDMLIDTIEKELK